MARYDYDWLVLGGGAAGLTGAGLGASLGARTLLVERHRLGGDCTWTGCVPSKTLLKAAHVAQQVRQAGRYGLTDQSLAVDGARVFAHVRAVRRQIYEEADSPERLASFNVETLQGEARFEDPHTVVVETADGPRRLTARRLLLATGARPAVPPIDGLGTVPFLTSETLFELEALPERLVIIGGGPIGVEMAQAFRRLGSAVTVVDQGARILAHDDAVPAQALQAHLAAEGVAFVMEARVERIDRHEGALRVLAATPAGNRSLPADALLVATGRRPNVEGLGLEAAGVAYTERGITVDAHCRTSRRHLFAAGDVTGRYQFTHMSEHLAKVAATNALLRLPMKMDTQHVPWVTYTDPELAHVGATEAALQEAGTRFATYRFPYDRLDRAVTDGRTLGEIRVYARPWDGKILGASILGSRAGDLIGELAVAMRNGVSLRRLSDTIHPYPTYGLGVRRAADQWYARKQSPWLVRLVQKLYGYHGSVPEAAPERIV